LSLNPTNTANQLLATDANRGRVLSVMLLAQQGRDAAGPFVCGIPDSLPVRALGVAIDARHAAAVDAVFPYPREPAIDNMPRRKVRKMTLREAIWEAITAHSHHPSYPSEISVPQEKRKS